MSAYFASNSVISKGLATIVSEGALGFLILSGISVVVAIGAHRALPNFVVACGVTAVVSTALFNIAASMHLGFVDPFWLIAVVVGGGYAFVVSALIGAVLRKWRRRHMADHTKAEVAKTSGSTTDRVGAKRRDA